MFRANGTIWQVSYGATGSWTQVQTSAMRVPDLAFADFDGDGRTDVFRPNGSKWYVSYGATGRWVDIMNSALLIRDVVLGDFNEDSRAEVTAIWNAL